MKYTFVVFIMILILTSSKTSAIVEEDVEGMVKAKIMLKMISFDKNIDRFGNPIKIGVTDDDILIALRILGDTKIKGKSFQSEKIVLVNDVKNCHVVFIGCCMKNQLEEIARIIVEQKILSFGSDKNYLKKNIAIAIEIEDDLPVIWMNQVNSFGSGSDIILSNITLLIIKGIIKS